MNNNQPSSFMLHLRCLRCGSVYRPEALEYVCPCRSNQGSDLGHLDVVYDYNMIREQDDLVRAAAAENDPFIRRWGPLLPVSRASLPSLPVGNTPLLPSQRLGQSIGVPNLFLKDDGRNPSASFKDRASAVAVARARETGRDVIATASTGNAAAALSTLAASAGQQTVIFVPKSAPQAKIAQLLVYGSRVLAVDGSYDDAFDLCVRACERFGWYNRNTGYNPYMTEGKKTVSFEIAWQMAQGRWQAAGGSQQAVGGSSPLATRPFPFALPHSVFVSVGDGSIIGGVFKGFWELKQLGLIDRIPRIYGVQSRQSAALHNAWRDGLDIPQPVAATTRADSISVNAPRDASKALRAVRESAGAFVLVEDQAILEAILPLARLGGVFAEPAGAAAFAGLIEAKAQGLIQPEETVVVINTGSGLKDIPAAMQIAGEPVVIPPTLDAVENEMRKT